VARLKPAKFDEGMTLVEHLDELRTRLIVSVVVLVAAVALCFWQNNLLLEIANEPLPEGRVPITFAVTEPFMVTLTIAVYGGVLLALPLLIYQAYAFVLPAFSARERRVVLPIMVVAPLLFAAGVAFSYFAIVPVALKFLLNFNADEFAIEVRAREYYSFFWFSLISLGVLFQAPLGVLAVTRLGIVTPEQLAGNRRYAVLVIAVIAMLLPGPDPVTMLMAMAPLLLLYELSIQFAKRMGRPGDGDLEADAPGAP
jgi:sec-independent protein translocase protein TatC